MQDSRTREPSLLQALTPVGLLILMLFASVRLFGDNASYGPNQIALILCAGVGILIAFRLGFSWKEMEAAMVNGISLSMGAIFILMAVGCLIGTWMMAGVVPTMVYYGLFLLHPSFFYLACCLICAVVSISIGSSWTTASTIGIALIGICGAMDLSMPIAAGAIISGAYFGDKLSPLSDTTNLAPAMAGTDLFTHIRHLLWTTVPSIVISCALFLTIGLMSEPGDSANLAQFSNTLKQSFQLGPHLLIPLVAVLAMVVRKVPAFPALMTGALLGGIFAVIFQADVVVQFAGVEGMSRPMALLKGFWQALYGGFSAETGMEELNELLSRGGMQGMLDIIWLVIAAMMFGAVMEKTLMLEIIARKLLSLARGTGSLILATLGTCIGFNIIASDQYIAIVLPGRMFRAEFVKRGLHPKNLSRCLEDSGTITSPLIPWNSCGAFMAGALGVTTGAYFVYCFFNLLNPLISAFYGVTGISIERLDDNDTETPAGVVGGETTT